MQSEDVLLQFADEFADLQMRFSGAAHQVAVHHLLLELRANLIEHRTRDDHLAGEIQQHIDLLGFDAHIRLRAPGRRRSAGPFL